MVSHYRNTERDCDIIQDLTEDVIWYTDIYIINWMLDNWSLWSVPNSEGNFQKFFLEMSFMLENNSWSIINFL